MFSSLGDLGATLLAALHTRLEIFALEVEEEKLRLARQLVAAAAALFFLGLAAVTASVLLVVLLWDGYRVAVLVVLMLLYLVLGCLLGLVCRSLGRDGKLLETTLGELERDVTRVRSGP